MGLPWQVTVCEHGRIGDCKFCDDDGRARKDKEGTDWLLTLDNFPSNSEVGDFNENFETGRMLLGVDYE